MRSSTNCKLPKPDSTDGGLTAAERDAYRDLWDAQMDEADTTITDLIAAGSINWDLLDPKATPVINDVLLIADSEDGETKKTITAGTLPLLKRSSADFATFTEKTTPASADLFLIEDSVAGGIKKKVQIGNLPGGVWGNITNKPKIAPGDTGHATLDAILAATPAAGTTIEVQSGTHTLDASTNRTIPAGVLVSALPGARITIPSGRTLTVNGSIEAGTYQIFTDNSGDSTKGVKFTQGSVPFVRPEWWGALANDTSGQGATNNAAFVLAFASGSTAGDGCRTVVQCNNGNYYLATSLVVPANVTLKGVSDKIASSGYNTVFVPVAGFNAATPTITTNSTYPAGDIHFKDFQVWWSGSAGIYMDSCNHGTIKNVAVFGTNVTHDTSAYFGIYLSTTAHQIDVSECTIFGYGSGIQDGVDCRIYHNLLVGTEKSASSIAINAVSAAFHSNKIYLYHIGYNGSAIIKGDDIAQCHYGVVIPTSGLTRITGGTRIGASYQAAILAHKGCTMEVDGCTEFTNNNYNYLACDIEIEPPVSGFITNNHFEPYNASNGLYSNGILVRWDAIAAAASGPAILPKIQNNVGLDIPLTAGTDQPDDKLYAYTGASTIANCTWARDCAAWSPGATIPPNTWIKPATSPTHFFVSYLGGTTGGSEPPWVQSQGAILTGDGDVTWYCLNDLSYMPMTLTRAAGDWTTTDITRLDDAYITMPSGYYAMRRACKITKITASVLTLAPDPAFRPAGGARTFSVDNSGFGGTTDLVKIPSTYYRGDVKFTASAAYTLPYLWEYQQGKKLDITVGPNVTIPKTVVPDRAYTWVQIGTTPTDVTNQAVFNPFGATAPLTNAYVLLGNTFPQSLTFAATTGNDGTAVIAAEYYSTTGWKALTGLSQTATAFFALTGTNTLRWDVPADALKVHPSAQYTGMIEGYMFMVRFRVTTAAAAIGNESSVAGLVSNFNLSADFPTYILGTTQETNLGLKCSKNKWSSTYRSDVFVEE